jgi:dinuclear metal center YbgI/SA1388 family protein
MPSISDQISDICTFFDQLLSTNHYKADRSLNGIQVEALPNKELSSERKISIAFAVDAGLSCIQAAVNLKADLLVVHHGLFWGELLPITGVMAQKISKLLANNCSLYTSHLPLDGNIEVGNGAELLRTLGASDIEPFMTYKGCYVGAKGRFAQPRSYSELVAAARNFEGSNHVVELPFGKNQISSIGVVTGSGTFAITEAHTLGLDLFMSGEPKHEVYHLAKELGMSAIFAGHYATETFGLRALSRVIEEQFSVTTHFIAEPSGI